ncbi:MAG TPA: ABC transporter permease [Bryobacteraceae bacterium]|nr:ABC transporter permease [Bryobacteraceae bacterium]
MSLLSRIANVFRGERLDREIDEELASHLREAVARGRDPAAARQAFGSALRRREESRDIRAVAWLDSLRADAVYGWRQLARNKVRSAAAVLSLALATGATVAAFRLIDAVLLRPLPVANAARLREAYRVSRFNGALHTYDAWALPCFQQMRAAVRDQAELIAVSNAELLDLTYRSDEEMEKAYLQYVSGSMFPLFGIRPAAGRLLTENDDLRPGAHPYAVISYAYWSHRFGLDPQAVGRTFHFADRVYQIVGVAQASFTGAQPGTMVDIFVPIMMHPYATRLDSTWHRTLAVMRPGMDIEPVRAKLEAISQAFDRQRLNGVETSAPREMMDALLSQRVRLEPAASGASELRDEARRPLAVLGALVMLVLLIACANVANLMTAQAAARAREMALRVSIGGGRWRLVQLVLVESAWLAFLAAEIGAVFAWWSGPYVVSRISPPENPARLYLPADWRVLGFGLVLALAVTVLFGLAPALRASRVNPVTALKGGDDPHARRRLMHALIAVQVAFCFLVLFVAGLFAATFQRLSHQPTGFSADRVLVLDTVSKRRQPAAIWNQLAGHLRELRGVEAVALADEPLLGNSGWNNFISIDGVPPNGVLAYMRAVSPGWVEAMQVPLFEGRDFRSSDTYPGAALVNQAFARTYLRGQDPVGRSFDIVFSGNFRLRFQAIGLVGDVRYGKMREPILPQVYVPFLGARPDGAERERDSGKLIVRTADSSPLALAQLLRQEVPRARPEFRVSRIRTQLEINGSHTVRERLLATLAMFFAVVALALAGVGLYGTLQYSVVQRTREIGIRIAVGARAGSVARLITASISRMVLLGAIAGVGLGLASVRSIESLFYQVKATDLPMLVFPALALFAGALLAALPAVLRAARIDPAATLRME